MNNNDKKNQEVWLRGLSEKMIHERRSESGNYFYSVGFSCEKSSSGIANISVDIEDVRWRMVDQDPDKECRDIRLGHPDSRRNVSIRKNDGSFEKVQMTATEIVNHHEQAKKAFLNKMHNLRKDKKSNETCNY